MRKRALLILLLLGICLSFSGCGLSYLWPGAWPGLIADATDQLRENSESETLRNDVASFSVYPQQADTYEKASNALKWQNRAKSLSGIPIIGYWASAYSTYKSEDYYSAVATDSTLQKAIKAAEGDTRTKGFSLKDIPTPFIVIGVILLVLVVLVILGVILRMSKASAKAVTRASKARARHKWNKDKRDFYVATEEYQIAKTQARADAHVQMVIAHEQRKAAEAQANAQAKLLEVQQHERQGTDAGQLDYLQRQCSKYGLNWSSVLQRFGGDPYKANQFIVKSTPEQLATLR